MCPNKIHIQITFKISYLHSAWPYGSRLVCLQTTLTNHTFRNRFYTKRLTVPYVSFLNHYGCGRVSRASPYLEIKRCVQRVVFAFESVHFFEELGFDVGRLELQLLKSFDPPFDRCRQGGHHFGMQPTLQSSQHIGAVENLRRDPLT